MKKLFLPPLIMISIGISSCESAKDQRLKDLSPVACNLTASYQKLLDDPENEKAKFDLIGQQSEIESGLSEDTGITVEDLKAAMKESCDNADLLESALKYD
jgi:hypothetical protein